MQVGRKNDFQSVTSFFWWDFWQVLNWKKKTSPICGAVPRYCPTLIKWARDYSISLSLFTRFRWVWHMLKPQVAWISYKIGVPKLGEPHLSGENGWFFYRTPTHSFIILDYLLLRHLINVYPLVNEHSNGISPCSIGNKSSKGPFSSQPC